jgi:hypothetical protein
VSQRHGTFAGFVASTLFLLLACTQNQAQVRASGELNGGSEIQEHRLDVPEAANGLELVLDIDLRAGEMSWTLAGPQGAAAQDGSLRAGERVRRTHAFAPVRGTWTLRVESRDATGSYDIRLSAKW